MGIVANWQAGYSDIFPREAGNLDFISSVLIVLKKTLCVPGRVSLLATADCHHFVASVLSCDFYLKVFCPLWSGQNVPWNVPEGLKAWEDTFNASGDILSRSRVPGPQQFLREPSNLA